MIITTRFKDIPFDEVGKCNCHDYSAVEKDRIIWESKLRNKPVHIYTPARVYQRHSLLCSGPFYDTVEPHPRHGSGSMIVCPHIAEIGD